jgi:hypothetical protein
MRFDRACRIEAGVIAASGAGLVRSTARQAMILGRRVSGRTLWCRS